MKSLSKPDAGVLYATYLAAVALRVQALAAGDAVQDADAIVAQALKSAWPKGRNEAWRYLCEDCVDAGWQVVDCPGDATCQRTKAHGPHHYARRCWCAKGREMTAKPRNPDDAFAAAAKMPKPSPRRFGR